MDNEKYTKGHLETLEKSELRKKKIIANILSAQEPELSMLERFLKKTFIPLFVPILTLFAGFLYFYFNHLDSEKAKALDRYKTEIEMVKLVWPDIKSANAIAAIAADGCLKAASHEAYCLEMDKNKVAGANFKSSLTLLSNFFNANRAIYEKDSCKIGISPKRRPIYSLLHVFPGVERRIINDALKQTKTPAVQIKDDPQQAGKEKRTDFDPVIDQSRNKAVTQVIDEIQKNANTLTVYIQYSDQSNKSKVIELSDQLRKYYVVPPIDFVENKSHYTNEIRYYQSGDAQNAIALANRLKKITKLDFSLKNIKSNAKGIIEIWYDNRQEATVAPPKVIKDVPVNEGFTIIADEERYAALGFFNSINQKISVFVDGFNEKSQTASMRINDIPISVKAGTSSDPVAIDDCQVILTVHDFARSRTLRKVLSYHVTVRKKI